MGGAVAAVCVGGGDRAQLFAENYTKIASGSATTNLTFTNAGQVTVNSGVLGDTYAWLIAGAPGTLELVITVDAGTLSTGAAGTFNLGTSRTFGVTRNTEGSKAATISATIRTAGGGAILAGPVSISLLAEVLGA